MKLIDADALIPMMKKATTDKAVGIFPILIGFNEIKQTIDEAPTIDALEVVRCKDCKHFDGSYPMCCRFEETFEPEDYCSFGEKREVKDETY